MSNKLTLVMVVNEWNFTPSLSSLKMKDDCDQIIGLFNFEKGGYKFRRLGCLDTKRKEQNVKTPNGREKH